MKKETLANDHALPDYVFNRGKQSVARSKEENDSPSNHDQQKARTADISNNTCQTFTRTVKINGSQKTIAHCPRPGVFSTIFTEETNTN